jgi:tRNA-dihydrouridine synthase B
MLGRGVYGRPWLAAHLDRALIDGTELQEPGPDERLAIVAEHLACFYRLLRRAGRAEDVPQTPGLVRRDTRSWPADPAERRAAKSRLCRLDDPEIIIRELKNLWLPMAHFGNSPVEFSPQLVEADAA